AYWNLPKSVQRSLTCSMARLTRDDDGNLPVPHTSGQIPHAGRALQITTPNINPALPSRWQSLRPSFVPEPTPAEQTDLERRAHEHSSGLLDEINLDT
ncbi:hypothetical protein HID58_070171, partial [Brassica napus]